MFRKDFAAAIINTGLVTLRSIRPFTLDRDPNVISEFSILDIQGFDDVKAAKMMAEAFGLSFLDLSNAQIPNEIKSSIKRQIIIEYRIIPIQRSVSKIVFATFDPTIKRVSEELTNLFRLKVEFILTSISSWKSLFSNIQESVDDILKSIVEVRPEQLKKDAPQEIKEEDIGQDVVSFVNKILAEAFIRKVSDIHIEPYEKRFRIRFRQDGSLFEYASPPKSMMLPMISRFKIMASMDIAEKRLPQDGRIKLMISDRPIDYRVSSLPTLFGEKIVLRLLDQSNLQLDMTKLGFEQKQLDSFKDGIFKPFGMVLVTGPTGSGKTTTLYSALSELNKITDNISTAEDPVEFNLEGINQVNVRKDIGLTFASALKSFLRQDPDIIMVGEIRDYEVAEIAVEAALTGHLVLSTLHTNDASSTVTRLLNMGIEPFLVTAALNTVVAQRLCRRICEFCKHEVKIPVEQIIAAGISPASADKIKTYEGKGCEKCNGSGYKGRVAIYEVLTMSAKLKEILLKNGSSDDIKRQAIKEGMKTLRMSALTKVAQGATTLVEALSSSGADDL